MSCFTCFHKLLYHILKLFAKENGNDSRRCLVCAKSVIISYIRCALTEQICMDINCLDNAGKYQQELDIFIRCITGIQKIYPVICSK